MLNQFAARIGVGLILLTAGLSQRSRTAIANLLADFFWLVALPRRRTTLTNLRLCFPQMPERERMRIGRRSFRSIVRAAFDHSVLWKAGRAEMERYIRVEGSEILTDATERPLIIVMPHFLGIDAGGVGLSLFGRMSVIYSRQKNEVWEAWLRKARDRFNQPILFQRQGIDLRKVIRVLKDGIPLGYLPDVDLGATNSIFVPFFGINAATIPMVSRMARLTDAKVVTVVTEMTLDGYIVHIEPPWQDFPGASIEADTARMNREIERWVLRLPDQYLWSHKRFKTRPEGEASVY